MQTAMERHNMLYTIEDGFSNLYDMVAALHIADLDTVPTSDTAEEYAVMVRSVLHDDTPWEIIKDEKGAIEYKILNHQRYIHIRNNEKNGKVYNEWILSSSTYTEKKLKRILLWVYIIRQN